MKKKVFKILSFICLTLAGVAIGFIILHNVIGKNLIFGSMAIISLFISAWVFYNSSRKMHVK